MPRTDHAENVNKSLSSMKGRRNTSPQALRREMVDHYKDIIIAEMAKKIEPHMSVSIPPHLEGKYDKLSNSGYSDQQIRNVLKKELLAHLSQQANKPKQNP